MQPEASKELTKTFLYYQSFEIFLSKDIRSLTEQIPSDSTMNRLPRLIASNTPPQKGRIGGLSEVSLISKLDLSSF